MNSHAILGDICTQIHVITYTNYNVHDIIKVSWCSLEPSLLGYFLALNTYICYVSILIILMIFLLVLFIGYISSLYPLLQFE